MGLLGNWLPDDPEKAEAVRQGLLAAGGAMMSAQGQNFLGTVGHGLMAGGQGYSGARDQQQQNQLRRVQMQQTQLENQKLQAAADEPMQLQKILSGGPSAPMGPPPGLPRLGGAPSTGAPAGPASAPTIAPASPADQYATLMGYAERLTQAGRVAQAKPYYEMAEKVRPKLMKQEARMVDGQRVMANVYEDGRTERVDGFAPDAEKLSFQNTGGATVALDPFTGKPVNTIRNTQSPDSFASGQVQMRGQNMTDARARIDGAKKAPPGYRWAADGVSLEAIPGGPASKSATSTEGERKAATLLMRMEGSERQLQDALKDDASAEKPGLVSSGLRAVGGETLANTSTGEARQRVEAAQLDILDSALTLGTGAAYTREQLESYRKSYFPQIGDKPKNIAEKQERLRNVIAAAKIAAGRAGPAAEAAIETPAKSVKDLPKKPINAAAYADAEKERRYQDWKRSQGK